MYQDRFITYLKDANGLTQDIINWSNKVKWKI